MKKLLDFLSGKKTSIATIAGAILVYLLNDGKIGADEAQLITVIMAALGITANVSTAVIKARNKG